MKNQLNIENKYYQQNLNNKNNYDKPTKSSIH